MLGKTLVVWASAITLAAILCRCGFAAADETAECNNECQICDDKEELDAAKPGGDSIATSANQVLAARVARAIRNGGLHHYEIDIETRNGVVTLSGTVGTEKQRIAAEDVSRVVNGVSRVINNLTIAAAFESTKKHLYKNLAEGLVGALGTALMKAGLETVLMTPDEHSALILFQAAGVAFGEKRLEDSAFLLYAGQLRMRFDQQCFPPTGKGGDDPLLPAVLISQALGSCINPAIMAEPKAYQKAIDRLNKWSPKAPHEYSPSYEFNNRLSEKDAHEAAKPNRAEFLRRMGDLALLLNNAEYFAAFRVIQEYNLGDDDKVPDNKEEREKATETMKRIEKDMGLKGIYSE